MRGTILAVLAVPATLATAGATRAQPPAGWVGGGPVSQFAQQLPAPVYPANAPPAAFAGRPVLATAGRVAFVALAFFGDEAMQWTGLIVPRAFRVARLLARGSPYPGRPLTTALWVAFPLTSAALDRLQGGSRAAGGPTSWEPAPCCGPAAYPATADSAPPYSAPPYYAPPYSTPVGYPAAYPAGPVVMPYTGQTALGR